MHDVSQIVEQVQPAGGAAPGTTTATAMGVIVDFAAQFTRLAATLTILLALVGILCFELMTTAQQFTRTAKSSRQGLQNRATSRQGRSAIIQSQPQELRERQRRLQQGIDEARKRLELDKWNEAGTQLRSTLEQIGSELANQLKPPKNP